MIAILLHCFFLSTFAWLFVQGLHIYRMQTEARNVNFGAMRFYYAIGWGVPAIITGKSCCCYCCAKSAGSRQPPGLQVLPGSCTWWGELRVLCWAAEDCVSGAGILPPGEE